MYAWEERLEDAFMNLVHWQTVEASCAFLHTCWFLDHDCVLESKKYNHLILVEGEQDEIYSHEERYFMDDTCKEVGYYATTKRYHNEYVDFHVITTCFSQATNIYYAIEFMKIGNKALGGYNLFLITFSDAVFIGFGLPNSNSKDCLLSFPITERLDWSILSEILLARTESDDLKDYYHHFVMFLDTMPECYERKQLLSYDQNSLPLLLLSDEDPYDRYDTVFSEGQKEAALLMNPEDSMERLEDFMFDSDEFFKVHNITGESKDNQYESNDHFCAFDIDTFAYEVQACMDALAFIKPSKVNTLELLFDSEESLEISIQEDEKMRGLESKDVLSSDYLDAEYIDDPIELIKRLTNKRRDE